MTVLDLIRQVLAARPDVRLAYVFGSAARGEARPSSDVDVAVFFSGVPEPRDLDRLSTELEAAAHRSVDLVVLNTAPPLLAHEVIAAGRLLVCADEDERVDFEARAIARYLDSAYLRRVQHAYLRQRVDAYRARPA